MLATYALSFALTNLAITIEAIIPITTKTTISSTRVKPLRASRMLKGNGLAYSLLKNVLAYCWPHKPNLLLAGFRGTIWLEQSQVLPVTLGLQPGDGNEAHRRRVHAVPQTGRSGTVVEDVAEMGVGGGRAHLRATKAREVVCLCPDVRRIERSRKAWPSGA